jgi:hypothetical protein
MLRNALSFCIILAWATVSFALDGIAIAHAVSSTPQDDVFGQIVRYDIKNSVPVSRKVIFAGEARCVCMNATGDSIAFHRKDGANTWISIMSINGGAYRDVITNNVYNFFMDWPRGDYIYYNMGWPRGTTPKEESRKFYRVNVKTAAKEHVVDFTILSASDCIWHRQLSANGGRMAMTAYYNPGNHALFDMSQIQSDQTARITRLSGGCSFGISPSGTTFTNNQGAHVNFLVRSWDSGTQLRNVNINTALGGDHFNWMHFGVKSEQWIVCTQGTGTSPNNNHQMVMYHTQADSSLRVSSPSLGSAAEEWADDFWMGDPDSKSPPAPKVDPPSFTPGCGSYTDDSLRISIACATAGASIYYTTNGQDPTAQSPAYTAPFVIKPALNASVVVKARALKSGMTQSDIASCTYTHVPVQAPVITVLSPNGGERLTVGQTVTIRWQADVSQTCANIILLSINGGRSYDLVTPSSLNCADAQWGAYQWTIPATWGGKSIVTDSAKIKVQDYETASMNDVSDSFFGIRSGASVVRMGPRSGRVMRMSGAGLDISDPGPHTVRVLDLNGRAVFSVKGDSPGEYRWSAGRVHAGVYIVEVRTPAQSIVKRVGAFRYMPSRRFCRVTCNARPRPCDGSPLNQHRYARDVADHNMRARV